jgi:hypothetical protein
LNLAKRAALEKAVAKLVNQGYEVRAHGLEAKEVLLTCIDASGVISNV